MPDYGAANRFLFDDPNKWHTLANVPILDEHVMSNDDGHPVATVDRNVLQQIADNNNRKVRETGDPATLILGHTSDDPSAPEKPAKGFAVNYKVRPFRRDPKTGQIRYTIAADFKVRHKNKHLLEEFPRRSVELWWNKKDIDPIALLGGSSPERDLGVVIRNGRINHVSVDKFPASSSVRELVSILDKEVIQFSTRGKHTIETYSIPDYHDLLKLDRSTRGKRMPQRYNKDCGYGDDDDSMKYEDGGMNTDDLNEYDPGDEGIDNDNPDMGEEDPIVAKVMQSKQMKDMQSKIDLIFQAVTGGEQQNPMDQMGGDEQIPSEMPPPQSGMEQSPMPGAEGMSDDLPSEEEDESRRGMGERPVQMNQSTGLPGPMDTAIPGMNSNRKNRMSRGNQRTTHQPIRNGRANNNRSTQVPSNPELVRLQKQNNNLRLKLARSEAERIVNELESQGVLFTNDSDPQKYQEAKQQDTDELTYAILHDEDSEETGQRDNYAEQIVDRIKTKYARKRPDPARPSSPRMSQYSRQPENQNAEEDDFEPETPQQGTELAELQIGPKKLSRQEAIKAMRKKYGRR